MNHVEELEAAVERLSTKELATFRTWFARYDAAQWDADIELDVSLGKLDAMAEEALAELQSGRAREL